MEEVMNPAYLPIKNQHIIITYELRIAEVYAGWNSGNINDLIITPKYNWNVRKKETIPG